MQRSEVTACNPLLRTPLSLIVDDSCAVVNLAYYWMKERHAWKARHEPGEAPDTWEGDPARVDSLPRTIPADFARRWGEWCAEEGIRGKFSMIPFPAGVGRIDRGMPGFPRHEFDAWLRVTREVISPGFDITPEMLTHTHVVDLETWKPTEGWEQVEWVDPPVDMLPEYVAAAMRLLVDAGVACDGVTSPGAFGKRQEDAHARAVLDAAKDVTGNPRPFYFLWHKTRELPDVPIWHADRERGEAVASVVGSAGDWFGGWTGFDAGEADLFIAPGPRPDGKWGGRLPEVLAAERPCVLVGHWPGFYFGGDGVGFEVLKEVKRRLDAYDPDGTGTIWMKCSEIGRYWMARELSEIVPLEDGARIATRFPAERFTLRFAGCEARRVLVDGKGLERARTRRAFRAGTFLVDGADTVVAFDLREGATRVAIDRG